MLPRSFDIGFVDNPFMISIELALMDKPLYKYFSEEKYAEAFCKGGQIKLTALAACRQMEGERGDGAEGSSTYHENTWDESDFAADGNSLSFGNLYRNNLYHHTIKDAIIFCMSLDPNLTHFGTYCVKITDPHHFINCVTLQLFEIYSIYAVHMKPVAYVAERSHKQHRPPPPPFSFFNLEQNNTYTTQHPESLLTLNPDLGPLCFIKPREPFQKDKEVRILWQRNDPTSAIKVPVLTCPEIAAYCERIK